MSPTAPNNAAAVDASGLITARRSDVVDPMADASSARIAPAPRWPSRAGRSESSCSHRSPAAMTATDAPWSIRGASRSATARALRRQPITTSPPASATAAAIVDPFGDGRTRRGTGSHERRPAGDSDGTGAAPSFVASSRPTASTASRSRANVSARSSFHRYG
ncbi:hypothetical protein BJF85_09770 [Saccharomonospora sp. CUA-673]|nr:hypothetical protein BJF85_09770 [Saccharomonospora sp. CUA-673]